MREGLGSVVIIEIIVVFIVVVSTYLAFNVNYMKAFKMKNKIIDIYEKYYGKCDSSNGKCLSEIGDYADEIGYAPDKFYCGTGYKSVSYKGKKLYCYKEVKAYSDNGNNNGIYEDLGNRHYYKITTKIDIDIPIFDNIFEFSPFTITGDTRILDSNEIKS